jgi:hypothetical protein
VVKSCLKRPSSTLTSHSTPQDFSMARFSKMFSLTTWMLTARTSGQHQLSRTTSSISPSTSA